MTLLYFAWIRLGIGHASETVRKPTNILDVEGLIAWLRDRGPAYAAALADREIVRVAVNQEYVSRAHPVNAGDEVAFFPPVTGG